MIHCGGPIAVNAERFSAESSYAAEMKKLCDMTTIVALNSQWFEAAKSFWETVGGEEHTKRLPLLCYSAREFVDAKPAPNAAN